MGILPVLPFHGATRREGLGQELRFLSTCRARLPPISDRRVSHRSLSPKGFDVNSRGWQPTVTDPLTHDPDGVERGGLEHNSTPSGSVRLRLVSVGCHPRLFTLNPFGVRTLEEGIACGVYAQIQSFRATPRENAYSPFCDGGPRRDLHLT